MPDITFDPKNGIVPVKNSELSVQSPLTNNALFYSQTPSFEGVGKYFRNDSRFDEGIQETDLPDVENYRGENQPAYSKLADGIIKGGGLAATTFLTTFTSLPYGILSAVAGAFDPNQTAAQAASKIYDNPISNFYDQFNKKMEDIFPNYYTNKEKNASAFSPNNWFTVNFLADKLIKNAGFTLGAIGSGAIMGKAFGALGKLAMAGKYEQELNAVTTLAKAYSDGGLNEGLAFTKALNEVGKGIKLTQGIQTVGATLVAAGNEATFEGLQTKQGARDDMVKIFEGKNRRSPNKDELNDIDKYASAAGNVDYVTNLAILGASDYIQFGRILSGAKNETKALLNGINRESGEYVAEEGSKIGKYLSKTGIIAKGPISEGSEEMFQSISQQGSQDYWSRKYDKPSRDSFADKLNSLGKGISDTFQTKQGLESMLLGALTGIISGGVTGEIHHELRENSERELNTRNAVEYLNKYKASDIFQKNESLIDGAVRGESIGRDMDIAIKSGDIYQYKNLQHDLFKNYVESRIKTGKVDQMVDELNDLKHLSKEEFENTWGIDPTTNNKKSTSEYVDHLITTGKNLSTLKENLDLRFPHLSEDARTVLWDMTGNVDNIGKRITQVSAKLSKSPEVLSAVHEYLQEKTPESLTNLNTQLEQHKIELESTGEDGNSLVSDYIKLNNQKQQLGETYSQAITEEGQKGIEKKVEKTKKDYDKNIENKRKEEVTTQEQEAKNTRVQETDQKLKNKQLTDIATKLYNKQELTPEEKEIYQKNDETIEMIHSDIQNAYAEHAAQQAYEQSQPKYTDNPYLEEDINTLKNRKQQIESRGKNLDSAGEVHLDMINEAIKIKQPQVENINTPIDNPFGEIFNPTQDEIQEHATQISTGYTDPTYYDNTKDSNIDNVVNKLNDQLKDSQGAKSVDVNGNITIEANKISDGYQALGYLSREYELVEGDNNKKSYKDVDNDLIQRMDKLILSTAKFNPGEEVELFINEEYEGDFYDPSIKDNNKALLSWKSYLDSLKSKYGQEYKTSDEYIKNVPIGIKYKGETLNSTYYHQNSWINENKVAGNIEEDRLNNELVRKYIVENSSYNTSITSKGNGVLFRIKEYLPLIEATEDTNPIIAVVDKDQTFKVAKGKADASYFQDQTINVKDLQVGGPVLLAEVNQGKYMAIPLKNQQISKSKYANQVKESITKAIENYLDNNKGDKLTLDVLKSMKLDITSIEGMEKYVTTFINNFNTNKQDLQDLQKSGALPVNTNNTIFSINKGNIAIKQNGTVYYIGKNLQKKRELFFTQLDKALDNLYLHTNIESLSTNENLILSGIDEPISYKTFMSETTLSNIKGFKVDEVNGKPIYSYTIQKVVRLDFGPILHEGEKEAKEQFDRERDEKDLPQPEESENKEIKVNKPKLTLNFQLEDFNELPELSQEQEDVLQKASERLLIPGLNETKQRAVVDTLVNSVINKVYIEGKVDTNKEYKQWKDTITNNRDEAKIWLDDEKNKSESTYQSYQRIYNSLDSVIKGWDTITKFANEKYANIQNLKVSKDNTLDEQEVQSSERGDYNKNIVEKDPSEGLSSKVKTLLSGIQDIDKNGKAKLNWLGEPEMIDYRVVYTTFQQWSTDLLRPNFDDMLTSIKSHESEFSWVPNAINKLDNLSDQDRKAFVNDLLNHYKNMMKVMFDEKSNKGGFVNNIQSPSKLSSVNTLVDIWKSNLVNSSLVTLNEGDYVFDTEKTKELSDSFKELQKNKNATIDQLKSYLDKFNITLPEKAWMNLSKGYYRVGNKKLNVQGLLTNSYSPFVVLNNSITLLAKNRTLEDANILKQGAIEGLIKFAAKYTNNLYSPMVRTAGKTVYPFNKNTYVSNRFLDLTKGDLIERLKVLPFNKGAYWLQDNVKDIFKSNLTLSIADMDSIKKHGDRRNGDNELHNLPESDYEMFKLGLIHASQEDQSGKNERIISLLYPTQSDKSTAIIAEGIPAFKIGYTPEGSIDEDTLSRVYNQLVLPEINRIVHFQKLVDAGQNINVSGLDKGWNKFYFIPSINTIEGVFVDGKLNTNIQADTTLIESIKEKLSKTITQLVKEKLDKWNQYGLIEDGKPRYIDNRFIKEKIKGIDKENYEALNQALANDVVVQYLVGNANMFMTMIVDPANAYKSKSNDPIIQMKETFNNIGKRLAGDIAPGSETEANKSGIYRQAMVSDRAIDSDNLKQLQDLLKEKAKDYTKEEVLKEGTNAQEFTTVAEQIARYYHEGVVAEDFYKSVIDTIHTEIGKNNHQYTSQIVANLNKVNPEYGKEFSDRIFQVEKPVYVDNRIDNDLQHEIRHYIKTSAYALTPELTQGNDLDNIRIAMEKQGIDRLAFSSGIKLGNFSKPISLWDNEGKIKNPEDIDFTNSSVLLNRSGFRIQQLVPIEEEKSAINRVSQASKNLFLNLHDVDGFNYHDQKNLKGSDLDKIYQDNYRQIFDIQKNTFASEIGYDLTNKRFVNTQESIDKIKKLLLEEATSRNYSINETESIQLDDTLKLLAFSASSQRMESLLNSLIQNRVLKITQPGKSFVLSTEEGYQTKEVTQNEVKSKKGIVYTSNWTGKLLPQRIENGVVKPAQAIVPFKFRNNEGDLLHIEDFIDKETGLIDANKLPEELRQLFGMRIPNQGLNSQSWIEIVGFMPHNAGDVIVATRDYLVQMGSDFDVDKLYTYMYSTYYDQKSGKLKKFKATPKVKESLSETMEESKIPDEVRKKELLNNILDVHIAIHSNTKDEVQKQIFEPLGTWEFSKISERLAKTEKSKTDFVGISDQYQQDIRLNNATDKALVGIYSNLSMFNAVAQNKDLRMISGYTKDGMIIPFTLKFGDKKSGGDLSKGTTIGDNKTNKSEVISGLQSCAVDGAKLQILGKFNHNLQTAKYVNLLTQLGFKDEVALFTTQPIIKDLIKEVKNSQSIIKPYESDILTKTIVKLKESTKKSIENFDQNLYEDKYSNGKGLSIENMWDSIEKDNPDKKYIQLAALEQFEYLTPYANTLSAVMSAINTDSKGLDKNLLETNIKYENVLKNVKNGNANILNVEKLLENNINGAATDILEMSNNIWNNFLPYQKEGVKYYFENIMGILGKQDLSITRKAELQKEIFDEFKGYLFSKEDLGLSDKDLYSERQRLFFGENSLANTISKLQEQENWKNHAFIGKLYYELNKNGLPSITKINAVQEDIVEQSTLTGAYDMLINNKKIEGTEYTTRSLMQDLILGAYITGGIQQAQQYLKYIPQSYLHTIPFADKLSQMVDKFKDSDFMQIPSENSNIYDLPSFVVQYFQHNSDKIKKIPTDKNGALQGIKKLESKDGLMEKFVVTNKELKEEAPIFLTTKAEKRKKGLSKSYIYITQGEEIEGNPVYTRIDNLGYSGFKEYNGNIERGEFAKSSIVDNNANNTINVKQSENEPQGFSRTIVNPEMSKTPFEQLEIKNGDKETIRNILNNIISEDTIDPYYKLVAQTLNDNIDKFNVNLSTDSIGTAGRYSSNGTINISPTSEKAKSINGISIVLLHEMIHAQTVDSIEKFLANKTKDFNKEQLISLTRLKNVFDKYTQLIKDTEGDKYKEFNDALDKYYFERDYNSQAKLKASPKDLSKYYPMKNLKEFVTLVLTDESFQKVLNEVPFDDNRTWLGKIFDEITNILSKMLGININKNSALQVALHDSMSLINNTESYNEVDSQIKESQESELPETIPSKKDILQKFNELSSDGHSKLMVVDKNGNTDNYHLMLKRAQNINKSQNLYQAKVSETVGEAIGRNNKEKYYYISLTPREDISLLDKMQNISNEEVLKRIKICEG